METKENLSPIEEIQGLKEARKAIILAHNYQLGEVQDIADFVGDSLALSQRAAKTDARAIVFCGVHFMAETAFILCPDKIVLLPDINAGCCMADMVTAEGLRGWKRKHPKAIVVCYINSSAEVKAESDICCTSANAVKVVESLNAQEILFVPDQYLGHYISTKTRKKITLWPGFCPTHASIFSQDIARLKQEHPEAKVMVHPECHPKIIALADEALSTVRTCKYVNKTEAKEIMVKIIPMLRKEKPGERFIPLAGQAICFSMKLITLEKVLQSLKEMSPEVKVPEEIRLRAKAAVDKMLEIGR